MKKIASFGLVSLLTIIIGCREFGKVDQGRVVDYDKGKRVCTIIRDKSNDPKNPDYSFLPPLTYELPKNPQEMGPEPRVGLRMKLDPQKKEIIIFDPAIQNFKTITYLPIEQKENVKKDDPQLLDKETKQPRKFPIVDREKKTITIYSKSQKLLLTFTLPDDYFNLPEYTWEEGDEVRIYYKEAGKALRFMNVTQTDIYKK